LSNENEILDDESMEESLIEAVHDSIQQDQQRDKTQSDVPDEVFIIPLTRRPFFPGMAHLLSLNRCFYEVLKVVLSRNISVWLISD